MRTLWVIGVVALTSCTTAKPLIGTSAITVTWKTDVAPQLAAQCGACHDGPSAADGYRVDSYLAAIGPDDSGGAVAVAGDATSRLLVVLDPATAQAPHATFGDVHALLVTWVVTDQLAYEPSQIHGPGIQNPASADFHGTVLLHSGWDFPLCQTCHGTDFAGGTSGVSCLTCHVAGPTSCTTCHGDSPTTGAHELHVLGGPLLAKRYACSECHITPTSWDSPDHIRNANGTAITSPVKVIFGPLANSATATRAGAATLANGTCTNVYCHGAATPDTKATMESPSWTSTAGATCTSCHGQPPMNHPAGACANCHGAVVDASNNIIDPALHITGQPAIGNGDGTCRECHSVLDGSHASHLEATHGLAAPIACTECHIVPAAVDSPGHFTADGLASVFPVGGVGPIANADSATPSWDVTTMQCSSTYCHGSGKLLSTDASLEIIRDPVWTPNSGAGRCGTCHGLPPLDGVHDPAWQITVCSSCHAKSVDASGAIIITNGTSTHLNGVVDAP